MNFSRTNRHQTNGGGPALNAFREQSIEAASNSFIHWRINHSATFNLTSVLSPTLVSTARFSWNRHQFAIHSYSIDYDPAQLGFASSLVSQVQLKSFPQFTVAGFGTLGRAGDQLNFSDTWAVGESLTKIIGRHSLKYGGEARQMFNNQKNIPGFGSFGFATTETRQNPLVAAATSGDALASMLLGYPNSVSSTYAIQVAQGQRYYTGFFQDDWRVNEKLTLNLGLRWEYESPISERFDRQVNGFDPDTTTKLGATTLKGGLKFASADDRLPYKRDLNNFGPRIGYAYLFTPKVVLRGGWGITYAPTADVSPNTGFSYTTAPATTVANAGITPITTPGCSGSACGMLSNPFPDGILQPPGKSLGLQTNLGQALSFILPSRVSPYVHSFSTGVQFELPLRSVVEISYSGNRTRQLPTSRNINSVTTAQYLANGTALTGTTVPNPYSGLLPGTSLNGATMTLQQSLLPYPQFGNITEAGRSIGTGKYDALMVRFEKRLSGGLTLLASGTFARNRVFTSYLNNGLDAVGNFIVRDDGASPWLINISGSYALPFFSKGNGLVKTILGGWQVTGTTALYPGGILDISGARSTGLDPAIPNPTYQRWFNTCTLNRNNNQRQSCASADEQPAWIIDPPFTLLTQAQPQWGSIRALHPQTADANFSIFKAFKVRERLSAELRAESFNALNTPHFGNPNLTSTSTQFGLTTLTQTNAPRNIQVGLKLRF